MADNKALPQDFVQQLISKLSSYFLYTTYSSIPFFKGEVAKHFDVIESNIALNEKQSVKDDNGRIVYSLYSLKIFDCELEIRFNHKVRESTEIKVPRVVKNDEKKWWQISAPDTKVIIETKKTEPKEYWLLASINEYVTAA